MIGEYMNIDKIENLKDTLGFHIAKRSSKLVDATGEDKDKLIEEIKNIQDDITSAYRDPSMIDFILSKYKDERDQTRDIFNGS